MHRIHRQRRQVKCCEEVYARIAGIGNLRTRFPVAANIAFTKGADSLTVAVR
jgi:hypothetical protein